MSRQPHHHAVCSDDPSAGTSSDGCCASETVDAIRPRAASAEADALAPHCSAAIATRWPRTGRTWRDDAEAPGSSPSVACAVQQYGGPLEATFHHGSAAESTAPRASRTTVPHPCPSARSTPVTKGTTGRHRTTAESNVSPGQRRMIVPGAVDPQAQGTGQVRVAWPKLLGNQSLRGQRRVPEAPEAIAGLGLRKVGW